VSSQTDSPKSSRRSANRNNTRIALLPLKTVVGAATPPTSDGQYLSLCVIRAPSLSACNKPIPTQRENDVIALLRLSLTPVRDVDQGAFSTKVLIYKRNWSNILIEYSSPRHSFLLTGRMKATGPYNRALTLLHT
jgi:hypothetical protein